jgi:hypothetical protein
VVAMTLSKPRRVALAAALFTAPWGLLVANTSYALMTRDGGDDETGAHAIALATAHPHLARTAVLGAAVGALLMVPAALGAMRLAAGRAPKLAYAGGVLMAAGYICYFAVALGTMTTIAMADRGGPLADYAAVLDATQNDPSTTWVFLLFVVGNLIGTLLLGLALLRSHAVPAWAAVFVMLWPPLHVTGLVVGSEWFEVTGAVLQGIGLAACGVRMLSDRPAVPVASDTTRVVVPAG